MMMSAEEAHEARTASTPNGTDPPWADWVAPGPGEWTPETQRQALAFLREPFAAEAIGLLPKPYKKDSAKADCDVCGGYHGMPALHLDYVGHAAVTDRLLTIDPWWDWEFMNTDDFGLPQLDNNGNMWITLTIAGMTRKGVGDGPDPKQRIGDALRNAGMRFGIALNLWTKDELESQTANPPSKRSKPPSGSTATDGSGGRSGRAKGVGMAPMNRNKIVGYFGHLDPPVTGPALTAKIQTLLNLDEATPLAKLSAVQGAELMKLIGVKSVEDEEAEKAAAPQEDS